MTTTMKPATTETVVESTEGSFVRVEAKALLTALQTIAPAVSKRSTLPILQNVLVEISTLGMSVSATNLEQFVTARVPLSALTTLHYGAYTVSYKELTETIKVLKSQTITLDNHDHKLHLSSSTIVTEFATMSVSEFPLAPARRMGDPLIDEISLNTNQFARLIASTTFAAADDDSRPVLTAVCIDLNKGMMTLACADAFRLSMMTEQIEKSRKSWKYSALLPAKAMSILVKKLPKDVQMSLCIDQDMGRALIEAGNVTIVTRMIEGKFPPYMSIVPSSKDTKTHLTVSTAALQNALQTIKPISKDSAWITRFNIDLKRFEVRAQREGMDAPMSVLVPDAEMSGKAIEAIYNLQYLSSILTLSKSIHFEINAATKHMRITSDDLPGWTAVIMPMHINR